jgi:short-subunit dehydrogenase
MPVLRLGRLPAEGGGARLPTHQAARRSRIRCRSPSLDTIRSGVALASRPNNVGRDFEGQVVLITGASAGVGRAAARAFARRGARLALAARDEEALADTKAELEALGARAEIFPLDVADAEAAFAAAELCEQRLGPIEIWVNNAMTTVFAPVAELRPEEVRRVTEVTYLGYVHGSMAALRLMRQRDRGVIIQVGSALAYRGIPLQAAYCGAKHAIQGFSDSLRTELLHAGSDIKVTNVHLPAVNTPQFDWARTRQTREPRPVAPVFSASAAADAIIHAVRYPIREYWVAESTAATILGGFLSPELMDRMLARQAVEGKKRSRELRPDRPDNLEHPVRGFHRTDGSFGGEARRSAVLVHASSAIVGLAGATLLLAGLAGAAIGAAAGTKGRLPRR